MTSAPRPRTRGLSFKFALASCSGLATLAVSVAIGEAAFRRRETPEMAEELDSLRRFVLDGQANHYEGRPHTVFGKPGNYAGRNSLGFNDVEWSVERRPGVPRIACIGSSTTEGGNEDGREGSFPFLLERALEKRYGREVEVMNFGLSGWTSAEELVNWFLLAQDYQPDLVILHEAANDVAARNYRHFRPDYVHYRKVWQTPQFGRLTRFLVEHSDLFAWRFTHVEALSLEALTTNPPGDDAVWESRTSTLPLDTACAFRRNLLSIVRDVESRGGRVALATLPYDPRDDVDDPAETLFWRTGIRQHNDILREIARAPGRLLIDLARRVAEHPAEFEGLFLDLVHLEPEGNRKKAEEIERVLAAEWHPTFP